MFLALLHQKLQLLDTNLCTRCVIMRGIIVVPPHCSKNVTLEVVWKLLQSLFLGLERLYLVSAPPGASRSPPAMFGAGSGPGVVWQPQDKEAGWGAAAWAAGISAPQAGIRRPRASSLGSCHPCWVAKPVWRALFIFWLLEFPNLSHNSPV